MKPDHNFQTYPCTIFFSRLPDEDCLSFPDVQEQMIHHFRLAEEGQVVYQSNCQQSWFALYNFQTFIRRLPNISDLQKKVPCHSTIFGRRLPIIFRFPEELWRKKITSHGPWRGWSQRFWLYQLSSIKGKSKRGFPAFSCLPGDYNRFRTYTSKIILFFVVVSFKNSFQDLDLNLIFCRIPLDGSVRMF